MQTLRHNVRDRPREHFDPLDLQYIYHYKKPLILVNFVVYKYFYTPKHHLQKLKFSRNSRDFQK